MSTCNRLDLQTLGWSQLITPKNLPDHWCQLQLMLVAINVHRWLNQSLGALQTPKDRLFSSMQPTSMTATDLPASNEKVASHADKFYNHDQNPAPCTWDIIENSSTLSHCTYVQSHAVNLMFQALSRWFNSQEHRSDDRKFRSQKVGS